jgi:hypothetical protein
VFGNLYFVLLRSGSKDFHLFTIYIMTQRLLWSVHLIQSLYHSTLSSSFELSISWEATSCTVTQEFSNILLNQKNHYYVQKSPPLVPIPSHITPVHNTPFHFSKIHFNTFSILCLGRPNNLFPSGFPTKIPYAFLFSLMRATCFDHLSISQLSPV